LQYVTFGRTGLRVSTISMGCNRLGDPGVDPAQWPPIVERALACGITLFDTSTSYNHGRSEAILGDVLAGRGDGIVVATKGGVSVDTNDYYRREFSGRTILAAAEGSLRRLRRDAIDLYMLHSPSVEQLERDDWSDAIARLKADGKIRFFGISTEDHASGIRAIELGADFLQIEYDLLTPTAEDALLPLAARQNIGIMVRMPLARGLLSGKFASGQPIPPEQQWRRPQGDQLALRLARIDQLRFLERQGQTLAQAAVRWILANPAVHCAIPGARTVEQLDQNAATAGGAITSAELDRVRALHSTWRAEGRW
jgi:aryl-alcohol dehydrogenase-like predicted oxidoreductase